MAARRTLAREVSIKGVALHAGVPVTMRIAPTAAKSKIRFRRTDLPDQPMIPAEWQNIVDSRFATVIGSGNATVAVTEHLLAALSGVAIDDCLIDLDGPDRAKQHPPHAVLSPEDRRYRVLRSPKP